MRIAILGAGLTGLLAARYLSAGGFHVTVFDKARSCGGRMTTKLGPCGPLDIGAQYFTARTDGFRQEIRQWTDAGIAAPWDFVPHKYTHGRLQASPDETIRYAGVGGMRAITDWLCDGVNLHRSHRAAALHRTGRIWRFDWSRGDCTEGFDWVLLTLPLEQVLELAAPTLLSAFTLPVRIHVPCHAVGIATTGAVDPALVGIFGDEQISWVSRQSAKPGCRAPETAEDVWMLHFSPAWSARAGREPDIDLPARACDWLSRATGTHLQRVASQTHYWAYANLIPDQSVQGPFVDPENRLAVAGAWCAGGRVEGAFLSARETCDTLLAQ